MPYALLLVTYHSTNASCAADDDDIETSVLLRFHEDTSTSPVDAVVPSENVSALSNSFINEHVSPFISDPVQEAHDNVTSPPATSEEPKKQGNPSGFFGVDLTTEGGHGKDVSGGRACCQQELDVVAEGGSKEDTMLANCQACVDIRAAKITGGDSLTANLWVKLVDAKEDGITKQQLKECPFYPQSDRLLILLPITGISWRMLSGEHCRYYHPFGRP